MKRYLLLTAILLAGLNSYSQWTTQEISTNAELRDVFFLNNDVGWVSGNTNGQGIIFRTIDGGNSWDSISTVPYGIMDLTFVDSLTGWGNLLSNQEEGVYKTIDGGFTWELVIEGWSECEFFNQNEGVLLDHDSPYPFYSTDNGGASYNLTDTLNELYVMGMGHIDFINPDTGFIIKHFGVQQVTYERLAITTDGGFTWQEKVCPSKTFDIFFLDKDNGYAQILSGGEKGLHKTTNSADSWDKVYFYDVDDVFFTSPDLGWLISNGDIIHTNDGGLNWETQHSGTHILHDVYFTDNNNGWIVGKNGLILHTNNGGAVGVDENNEIQSEIKVFPNPAKGKTNIHYTLDATQDVTISVQNITGQVVKTVLLGKNVDGIYNLDCTPFAQGAYLITIIAGEQILTKKLIVE